MAITYTSTLRHKCERCGEVMRPGTVVDQVQKPQEEGFKIIYLHNGGCPVKLIEV